MKADTINFDHAGASELTAAEIDSVAGAMNDWTEGGIAVMGLGLAGGPATGAFGLLVGGAMLIVGYYAQ